MTPRNWSHITTIFAAIGIYAAIAQMTHLWVPW